MKILTAKEMTAADRRSVEQGIPVATLMENAGEAVARFSLRHFADVGLRDGPVIVLCGKGNNGGDGMVAARHLSAAGCNVRLVLLGSAAELKGEPAEMVARALIADNVELREIADEEALRAALEGASLVVDAVVGTGFQPPLRGLAATARDLLAKSVVPVVAVDLPSGWDADSTAQTSLGRDGEPQAFRADAVITLVAPKRAHVFGHLTPGATFGPVVVADIGTPTDAVQSTEELHWAGAAKRIAETPRDVNGNKGKFGHILLIGGSFGKGGAPSMASLACMRAGAGLVTAAVPADILNNVALIAPELMCTPLAESAATESAGKGGLALEQLGEEALPKLLKGISVVACGPGLGQEGTTPQFVQLLLAKVTLPLVLDADALNALAGRTHLLREAIERAKGKCQPRTIVLTPHPGEMARLVDMTVKEVEADRLGLARRFATEHGVTLVLKGWRTLIAHPDGRIAVNTTGNPAMAKGGSGDILTGIVAAMLAQYGKEDVAQAVEAAVFLHGLAGDFATLAQEEHTVLATDTVAHLADAFRSRCTDAAGFTWIAGTAAAPQPKGRPRA